jgi:hypothetical protein
MLHPRSDRRCTAATLVGCTDEASFSIASAGAVSDSASGTPGKFALCGNEGGEVLADIIPVPRARVVSRLPRFTMARALVALTHYKDASTPHVVTTG